MGKPKKKYRPGKVVVRPPILVNSLVLASGLEQALLNVIKTGQAEVDELGKPIYRVNGGKALSFWNTLRIYTRLVELRCAELNTTMDLSEMHALLHQVKEMKVLDEECAEKALKSLSEINKVLAGITPSKLAEMRSKVLSELY